MFFILLCHQTQSKFSAQLKYNGLLSHIFLFIFCSFQFWHTSMFGFLKHNFKVLLYFKNYLRFSVVKDSKHREKNKIMNE